MNAVILFVVWINVHTAQMRSNEQHYMLHTQEFATAAGCESARVQLKTTMPHATTWCASKYK